MNKEEIYKKSEPDKRTYKQNTKATRIYTSPSTDKQ